MGIIILGRKSNGLSVGYQLSDQPCTIHLIDTNRPSASFSVVRQQPFCLPDRVWSPNRHYAAIRDFSTGALSIATARNQNAWQAIFDIESVTVLQGSPVWSADAQQFSFFTDSKDATLIGIVRMENGVPGKPRFVTVKDTYPHRLLTPDMVPRWTIFGVWCLCCIARTKQTRIVSAKRH